MSFLIDSDLKTLLQSDNPPIKGLDLSGDLDSIESQIQPCSIDLRISEIFLPFQKKEENINAVRRTNHHKLDVGESVKVTTREEFDLDNRHGALLVAPARLTRVGIIVPDVAHVDPGFKGQLRITLINMGRDPYELISGQTVMTVLLFRLDNPVDVGMSDRKGKQIPPYQGGLEDIRHLSPDFLNIQSRVTKLAGEVAKTALGESGWRHAFFSWCLPIIIGVFTALVTYYLQVESRLEVLESKSELFSENRELEKRVNDLESKIKDLIGSNPAADAGLQSPNKIVPKK